MTEDTTEHDGGYVAGRDIGTAVIPVIIPGVTAGIAGLVVFLALHESWILPIWFVAPLGLVIAVLGGAAVSWAYLHVKPHLPEGIVFRWLVVGGGVVLILVPSLVVAWASEPYFTVVDGVAVPTDGLTVIVIRFVLEFLAVTTLSGAVLGMFVTRTRRGTVAMAAAALALALGPGHNLPFFHIETAPVAARTAVLLTIAPILAASAVFVVVDRFAADRRCRQ